MGMRARRWSSHLRLTVTTTQRPAPHRGVANLGYKDRRVDICHHRGNGNQRSFRSSTLCRLRNRHGSSRERRLDDASQEEENRACCICNWGGSWVTTRCSDDSVACIGSAFLIMFLVGTVVAMGSYTTFIGSCSEALKEKVPRMTEKLTWVSSVVAIGLGLGIVITLSLVLASTEKVKASETSCKL